MSRSSEFKADEQRKRRSKQARERAYLSQNPSLPLPRWGFEGFKSKHLRAWWIFKAIYKPICTDDELFLKVRSSDYKWTFFKNMVKIIDLITDDVIIQGDPEVLRKFGERLIFRRCIGEWLAAVTHYVMAFVTKHLTLDDMFNYDWKTIMNNTTRDLRGKAVERGDIRMLEFLSRIADRIEKVFNEALLTQEAWASFPDECPTDNIQVEIPNLFL